MITSWDYLIITIAANILLAIIVSYTIFAVAAQCPTESQPSMLYQGNWPLYHVYLSCQFHLEYHQDGSHLNPALTKHGYTWRKASSNLNKRNRR